MGKKLLTLNEILEFKSETPAPLDLSWYTVSTVISQDDINWLTRSGYDCVFVVESVDLIFNKSAKAPVVGGFSP